METAHTIMAIVYYVPMVYLLVGMAFTGAFWWNIHRRIECGQTTAKEDYLISRPVATTCTVMVVYPMVFWLLLESAVRSAKGAYNFLTSPKPPNRTHV